MDFYYSRLPRLGIGYNQAQGSSTRKASLTIHNSSSLFNYSKELNCKREKPNARRGIEKESTVKETKSASFLSFETALTFALLHRPHRTETIESIRNGIV